MEQEKIKIAVVDDHEVFIQGIKTVTASNDDIEIIMEANNGREFLDLLEKSEILPHIVLLDVDMPIMDGIETVQVLNVKYPQIKILILTMHTDENIKQQLMDLKVTGFVHKHTGSSILEEAISRVSAGKKYLDPIITEEMQNWFADRSNEPHKDDELSEREKEVLLLICHEYTTPQIATKLELTEDTVKTYRKRLMDKTGCKNMVGLVFYAINNKLIKAEDVKSDKKGGDGHIG